MLEIKVYDCGHEHDLEEQLNNLIKQLEERNQEVLDIKYSTSHFESSDQKQIWSFSALVMYDDKHYKKYVPKRYEIIEKVSEEE